MRRAPTEIRIDINRLAEERVSLLRELERAHAPELVPVHAELDKRIGWLWEELREASSPRGLRPPILV